MLWLSTGPQRFSTACYTLKKKIKITITKKDEFLRRRRTSADCISGQGKGKEIHQWGDEELCGAGKGLLRRAAAAGEAWQQRVAWKMAQGRTW